MINPNSWVLFSFLQEKKLAAHQLFTYYGILKVVFTIPSPNFQLQRYQCLHKGQTLGISVANMGNIGKSELIAVFLSEDTVPQLKLISATLESLTEKKRIPVMTHANDVNVHPK